MQTGFCPEIGLEKAREKSWKNLYMYKQYIDTIFHINDLKKNANICLKDEMSLIKIKK